MPFLRKSAFMAECDVCGARFDPAYGGACESCRRALCSDHFHGGSLVSRIRTLLGARQLCVECRTTGRREEGDGRM